MINWVMFAVAVGIAGYMINTVLEKEEEKTVAYTRMQYNRKKGINEQTSFKF